MSADSAVKENTFIQLCREILQAAEDFIGDPREHTNAGVKRLIEKRRGILAKLERVTKDDPPSDADLMNEIFNRLKEQDIRLEAVIRRMQFDMKEAVNQMRKMHKAVLKYASKSPKPSIFIDKKR
ncbi:hypothetical protein ISS30_00430 [bacterium]|nr:hypothetical protein [FCB group bacterium]MBL7190136.1 hypothetical protein [bacterium]